MANAVAFDDVKATRMGDAPESWGCPDCSAMKNDFEMVEI